MLIERYLTSTKNLPQIFEQMVRGTAPQTFNTDYLVSVGFTSSNDRAVPLLLKSLGFLQDSGQPTSRYHAYRAGGDEAKAVLGEALLEAYEDIFHINAMPTDKDRTAIEGKFKASHNATDRVAEAQTATFLALLKLADIEGARKRKGNFAHQIKKEDIPNNKKDTKKEPLDQYDRPVTLDLRYKIEVHLPPTKDIEVYHAIFRSLKENLLG